MIVFEISFYKNYIMTLSKGITTQREIIQKNMGQLFFDEESIFKISNPILKFVRTDGRTIPKQYAPPTLLSWGMHITHTREPKG